MAKDYQDLQHLESEDNGHQFSKGPLSPLPILQRLCPLNRLLLVSLGFSILLVVIISVVGSKNTHLQGELQTLKETFTNFSEKMVSEIQVINNQGNSLREKMKSLEAKLQKHQKDRDEDISSFLLHEQHVSSNLRTLNCQMMLLQSNGTSNKICCPLGWLEFDVNCYWFSRTGKSWNEAEKYCQMENSHLVVINSWNEQNFVSHHTSPAFAWIGLTDAEGTWKWVDGTSYDSNIKNWMPSQPDNWYGHGLGGGEDCAHLHSDGSWNDDVCQRPYRWVCEMELQKTA
ncbi:asialoglycoprotein receptor 1-like isoform X1 [Dromiciops gliroides]|uniref:asialoglycoprotein receptor 1-like isoform X1 n=1 Tax=Dromiciops gliroides TaxID=33562 RepID=UPI001CC68913|nr:asialoglycoprotein receptor 1-like isoform X1 [Dromiciops gliroides]